MDGVKDDPSLQVVQRANSKLEVPDDQVSAIAEQLSPEEASRCDAAMIRRYVRACAGDSKQVRGLGLEAVVPGGSHLPADTRHRGQGPRRRGLQLPKSEGGRSAGFDAGFPMTPSPVCRPCARSCLPTLSFPPCCCGLQHGALCSPTPILLPTQRNDNEPLQALRRLHETLAWRAAERPEQLFCRACAREPKSHYMQVVAWDKGRRPTIYSCLSIPVSHSMEEGREHMVSVFEQAVAMMPPGVEDWVWVLDMHGFGLRDVDPRLAFAFLKISASHYPERLAQAYVVSAPRIFTGFWATISPFIDPKTKAKVGPALCNTWLADFSFHWEGGFVGGRWG